MRRLDGSILPCLERVPGTALLVIQLTTQRSVAERWQSPCFTPALPHLLHTRTNGNLVHATDTILPRQPNQMIMKVLQDFNG